jgi:hypothetical protein
MFWSAGGKTQPVNQKSEFGMRAVSPPSLSFQRQAATYHHSNHTPFIQKCCCSCCCVVPTPLLCCNDSWRLSSSHILLFGSSGGWVILSNGMCEDFWRESMHLVGGWSQHSCWDLHALQQPSNEFWTTFMLWASTRTHPLLLCSSWDEWYTIIHTLERCMSQNSTIRRDTSWQMDSYQYLETLDKTYFVGVRCVGTASFVPVIGIGTIQSHTLQASATATTMATTIFLLLQTMLLFGFCNPSISRDRLHCR